MKLKRSHCTTRGASSSLSSSSTSLTENTEQLLSFWQSRSGGRKASQCEDPLARGLSDYRCISGRRSRRAVDPSFGHADRLERSPWCSTFIFTIMALLSAFLVVAVTLILVQAQTVGNAKAAAPVTRHFTLPPKPALAPRNAKRGTLPPSTYHTRAAIRFIAWERDAAATTRARPRRRMPQGTPSVVSRGPKKRMAKNVASVPARADEVRGMCTVVFYSYCSRVRQEFHFVASNNSCVSGSADATLVCNHSPNRFASERNCRAKCVDSKFASERCFSAALFSQCSSRDVRHQWWFFDGSECVPWNFPSGACPSTQEGSDVFSSLAECAAQCVAGESLLATCQPPTPAPCSPKHLRFPYFAVSLPEQRRVMCVRASASVLQGHRCLTGSNRFPTESSCREACALSGRRAAPARFDPSVASVGPGEDEPADGPTDGWRTIGDAPADVFNEEFFDTTTKRSRFIFW